jgi:hypothetical protein
VEQRPQRRAQQETYLTALPALKTKLALVLRDLSISEALAAVGKAAGVQITLVKGSLDRSARVLMLSGVMPFCWNACL